MSTTVDTPPVSPQERRDTLRYQVGTLATVAFAFILLVLQTDAAMSGLQMVGARYVSMIGFLFIILFSLQLIISRLLYFRRQGRASGKRWLEENLNAARLKEIAFGVFVGAAVLSIFTVHKTLVIGASPYAWDATFIAWDRAIFGGEDPWVYAHALFPGVEMAKWIDFLYHPTFVLLLISFVVCVVGRFDPALRRTFMLSYVLCFVIVGMMMALWLDSAGPIFDGHIFGDGSTFAPFIARLAALEAAGGPFSFTIGKQYLLILHGTGEFGIAGGISAMPSMHVVMAVLVMLGCWRAHWGIGLVAALYAIFVWFASVYLGWHYFVDGLVSIIVTVLIWMAAARFCGLVRPN